MNYSSEVRLLYNTLITEYDIRKGNVSVMRALGLKDQETLDYLSNLPKEERNRTVGLMIRDDKELGEKLEAGFDSAVSGFITANGLDPEVDITDIRRDAIFVVAKHIQFDQFADGIIAFAPKNTYHAMLKIGLKLSFFFPPNDYPRVSGLIRQDKPEYEETMVKLRPGMLGFLKEFIETCEENNGDKRKILKWMSEFVLLYKKRELDAEYYREFTRDAKYRIHRGDQASLFETCPDQLIDEIDISFNFRNILLPILQILV